jgi:hypothetical protein
MAAADLSVRFGQIHKQAKVVSDEVEPSDLVALYLRTRATWLNQ